MGLTAHWRDFDDNWPSDEARKVFEKAFGSRVGATGDEWNEKKRWFLLAWNHLEPFRAELLKIAADLGEPNDPFAAWERIVALRAPVTPDKGA